MVRTSWPRAAAKAALFAAAATMLPGSVLAATNVITYTANRAVGDGSVRLSITTNGTIGELSLTDLVDFSFALRTRSGFEDTIIPVRTADFTFTDSTLFATADELIFDFDADPEGSADPSYLAITLEGIPRHPVPARYCLGNFNCGPSEGNPEHFFVGLSPSQVEEETSNRSGGQFVIASVGVQNVIPEPASWALMIAGFGLVGAATRRRAARVVFA